MFDKVNILSEYQEDSRFQSKDIAETLRNVFKCVQSI